MRISPNTFTQHPAVVTAAAASNDRVPLLSSPELQLRFLTPSDLPEVKKQFVYF